MQFSRGCPFRCEFCDIIVMFGRKPRTKSPAQVMRELDVLRELGHTRPFFVDDNFIGHKPRVKELLVELRDYQKRHGEPFRLGTEASLDLASDLELVEMMRDAGFVWLFMGIETPDEGSLLETGKTQNLRMDSLEAVRLLQAHSLDVYAGFIVGFDNDDHASLARQRDFIIEAGIQVAIVNLLCAIPKTPLYERMIQEGRLLDVGDEHVSTTLGTNVQPKQLGYDELIDAFRLHHQALTRDRAIADKVINKFSRYKPPSSSEPYTLRQEVKMLGRFVRHGVVPGGPRRAYHVLRSLPFRERQALSAALVDWAMALSNREFVDRTMGQPQAARTTDSTTSTAFSSGPRPTYSSGA